MPCFADEDADSTELADFRPLIVLSTESPKSRNAVHTLPAHCLAVGCDELDAPAVPRAGEPGERDDGDEPGGECRGTARPASCDHLCLQPLELGVVDRAVAP